MDCLSGTIDLINKELFNKLKFDRKKYFTDVVRYSDSNNNEMNLAKNENLFSEGELATWDDKYDIVWFNRVNSIRVTQESQSYGRSRNKITQEASTDLVVWAKTKHTWLTETRYASNIELYEAVASILGYVKNVEIVSADLNNAAVERSEFVQAKISKESICFKITYDIINIVNKPCGSLCNEDLNLNCQ